jgi:hypothetical protein
MLNMFIVANLPCSEEKYSCMYEIAMKFLASLRPFIDTAALNFQIIEKLVSDTEATFEYLKGLQVELIKDLKLNF